MVMAREPAYCRLLCELVDYLISVAYSHMKVFKYSYKNFFSRAPLFLYDSHIMSYKSIVLDVFVIS